MSSYTAADVTKQMTAYDTLVRAALDNGSLVSFMEEHLPAIRQFYATCKKLTGEPAAAYRRDCFLHAFIRAHKTEAGNPTFTEDLKKKRVKFDAASGKPAAPKHGAALPSVSAKGQPETSVEVGKRVGSRSADVVMAPPPAAILHPAAISSPAVVTTSAAISKPAAVTTSAAISTPAAVTRSAPVRPAATPVPPISRSTTAPFPVRAAPPPTVKAKKSRQETIDNGAAAGPGPSSKSHVAAANVRFAPPPQRTFTAIEEEDEQDEQDEQDDQDEDDQLDGEEAIRMMDEEGPRPRTRSKGKGKVVENDEESSDLDAYRRSPARVRPRPSRASRRSAAPRAARLAPRRTGRELQPPCSTCQLAERICQETVNGGACFSCKTSKRKCEFSEKKTVKKVKSKARVDSEEEEEDAQITPPPSSRARGTRQSSRAAGKQRAHTPDLDVERRRGMEIELDVGSESEVVYQAIQRRPGVRAAGVAQSPEETFGLLAARLELVTENAQRALSVPRADRVELQLRRCETAIDTLKALVLELCDAAGIFPVGLERPSLRPQLPDLPDPDDVGVNVYRMLYRDRGVGPDVSVGPIFVDRASTPAGAPPPPAPSTPSPPSPGPAAHFSSPAAPPSLPIATPSPPPPSPSPPPSPRLSNIGTDVEMAVASPLPVASPPPAASLLRAASPPPPPVAPEPPLPPAALPSAPSPPSSTLEPQPLPPPVPPVHLIGATPENSQEERAAGLVALPTTPPSNPSTGTTGLPVTAKEDAVVADPIGTHAAQPTRRPRGRTPNPSRLEPPALLGVQTRSRTRSPSPAPLAGDKRKGDGQSDGDVGKKKRKL